MDQTTSEQSPVADEVNIIISSDSKNDEPSDTVSVAKENQNVKEADTLSVQDQQIITVFNYSEHELARVFRSLSTLTPMQIRLIEIRYLSLLNYYERRIFKVDLFYNSTRLFISIGGVAVPALLSIQSPTGVNSVGLYWFTWFVSLLVTVCHTIGALFKFDKKYYGVHTTLERLKTEGIQYLELSGHYSGHHGHGPPTHENQYVYFVNSIERLRQRQVEDEYSVARDLEKVSQSTSNKSKTAIQAEQVVPSPMDLTLNRNDEKNIINK